MAPDEGRKRKSMIKREEVLGKRLIEAKAQIFKALGHPSRLRIVCELAAGERCVCELTDVIGADKSTVSKHLLILKQAGILQDEKRGNMVFLLHCRSLCSDFSRLSRWDARTPGE